MNSIGGRTTKQFVENVTLGLNEDDKDQKRCADGIPKFRVRVSPRILTKDPPPRLQYCSTVSVTLNTIYSYI